jgi:deazaflavin-dependent oxidoreductase (nitroreductase family)
MGKTTIITNPPRGILRLGLRLPIWLYRLHLGWLLGNRFLLLNHIGRKSGQIRQSVIEVVKHDQRSDNYFIVSGWGDKSDWYLNIHKNRDVVIQVGRRKLQVHAEDIPLPVAVNILEEYTRRYPMAFKELTALFLGERMQPGLEASRRLAEKMPMIVLRPRA